MKAGSFIGRVPLWATLIPLALGVVFWGWLWRDYAGRFEADLSAVVPDTADISVGGFPYRLEARIPEFATALDAGVLQGKLGVRELTVNRVPWQADRQVLNLDKSVAEIAVVGLAGTSARVSADEAQASLHVEGSGKERRIGRLSMVWEAPQIETGLLPVPIRAGHFEAHLRETPAEAMAGVAAGASPVQAQLVLAGKAVQFGAGAPLTFALDSEFTGAGPLRSYARWANGGAVEIRSATLSDDTGEVARLTATLRPDGKGALQMAGRIETVCPASVRAVVAGAPQPEEKRSRKPEVIAISGTLPGGLVAAPADPARPPPPVRGQQPPCPRLR